MITCITPFNLWDCLSAIGTIAMSFVALRTYQKSISEKKPYLVFELVVRKVTIHEERCKLWCLKISNIGQLPAKKVTLQFDENFIHNLPLNNSFSKIDYINNKPIHIRAGAELLYVLCPIKDSYNAFSIDSEKINKWLKEYRTSPINIKYEINNKCNNESLILEQFDTNNIIFLEN